MAGYKRFGQLLAPRSGSGRWPRKNHMLAGALLVVSLSLANAPPATADPPVQDIFEETFDDVNPCTGLTHTVTIGFVFHQHNHGERFVEHGETTITTAPTGFVGRGTTTLVENGQVLVFRETDILSNDAGDRIRARLLFVMDAATGTVKVEEFELTCVGA